MTRDADPARSPSLSRSSAWAVGGYAAGQLLRFAANLVLTRLVFPEVFGMMALITTLLQGLVMFSDIGIGPAIIQRRGAATERFLRTAWTLQCVRGAILFLCACALAIPFSVIYGEPDLASFVPVAGLAPLILGFEATSTAVLSRELRLRRITVVELASQAIGIFAMLALVAGQRALFGTNRTTAVWAVVAGGLVGTTGRVILSHVALPGIRHRFEVDRDDLRVLFGFGRWIFLSTMLTFLVEQSDRLIFGKMIPLDLLGVYGLAAALAMLPTQAVQRLGSAVLFPAFSRLQDRSEFDGVFHGVRRAVTLAGAAAVAGLLSCGPYLIRLLYDPRYAAAGWILQLVAVAGWLQILESSNSAAILAQGRLRWLTANRAARLASMLALLPLGFALGGFRGALVGLIASDAVKYATSAAGLRAGRARVLRGDVALTLAIAATAVLASGIARHVESAFGRPSIALLAAGTIVAATWGPAAFWTVRRTMLASRRAGTTAELEAAP